MDTDLKDMLLLCIKMSCLLLFPKKLEVLFFPPLLNVVVNWSCSRCKVVSVSGEWTHIRCDGRRDSPLCVSRSAGAVISHTERQRRGDRELDPHSYDQQVGSVSHRNKETTSMKQKATATIYCM